MTANARLAPHQFLPVNTNTLRTISRLHNRQKNVLEGCRPALTAEKNDEATLEPYFREKPIRWRTSLPVSLGHTLDLILLFDGVRVGRSPGSVDDLIGEALGDGLDVAERGLARAGGDQVQSLMVLSTRHGRVGRKMIIFPS